MKRGKAMGPIADRRGIGALRAGRGASDARRGTGAVLNPRQAEWITPSERDRVIVMAEV
jgi:hypothetical protein